MNLFGRIAAWFSDEVTKFMSFLKPVVSAYMQNLEAVGIKDVEAFLAAAAPIALSAGLAAVTGGLGGVAVRDAVVAALVPLAMAHGADATHDLLTSVLNTTAELQHQAQLAMVSVPVPGTGV